MNKVYEKPWIEIEHYTLDASIAASCGQVVTLGPGTSEDVIDACREFEGSFDLYSAYSARSGSSSFYAGGEGTFKCDCYYSSGGEGYFTS